MNPFLQKEWNELEIPENVHLRARNRAWARIRKQVPGKSGLKWRRVVLSFASVSTILLVVFFTSRNTDPETGIKILDTEQKQRVMSHLDSPQKTQSLDPTESVESNDSADLIDERQPLNANNSETVQKDNIASLPRKETSQSWIGPGKTLMEDKSFLTGEVDPLRIDKQDAEEPTQLVMHFILPETGVRMIWIKDDITSVED